jgi:nucleotide-binding universal stress UspA family protein
VTSRAEAQCVRLALIYALLDGAANIDRPHIRAALAVWEYAEVCAAHIFGASLGDNVADDILRALQNTGREGMSRTAIRDLFGRHQSADRIGAALALLASRGRAKMETRQSAGRPTEIWIAMEARRHG